MLEAGKVAYAAQSYNQGPKLSAVTVLRLTYLTFILISTVSMSEPKIHIGLGRQKKITLMLKKCLFFCEVLHQMNSLCHYWPPRNYPLLSCDFFQANTFLEESKQQLL